MELGRIEAVLARLRHPQRKFRSVLVAGTNGKGSTAAMIEAGLSPFGKVGLYQSPHLSRINERWRINGVELDDHMLADIVLDIARQLEPQGDPFRTLTDSRLTYFELGTCVAFEWFAREKVDWAVLEVGLGGRLDATNAAPAELAVITSIGLDHMQWLGDTTAKIAAEKAGVIKGPIPVLAGAVDTDAESVILEKAAREGAAVHQAGTDMEWTYDLPPRLLWRGKSHPLPSSLHASVTSGTNGLLAAAALVQLLPGEHDPLQGLANYIPLRGRQERLTMDFPRHGSRDIVLDGCHNPAACAALRDALEAMAPARTALVFGGSAGHDTAANLAGLAPAVDEVILTPFDHPRSLAGTALSALVENPAAKAKMGNPPRLASGLDAAIQQALESTGPGDRIVVAGSLFLVEPARAALESRW